MAAKRMTVTFNSESAQALEAAQTATGQELSEIVNRGVKLYAWMLAEMEAGNGLWVGAGKDEAERIRFL